jgi:hypothetical protein
MDKNRRELYEECLECSGTRVLRDNDCPACLGIGRVFVGYAEPTATPRLLMLRLGDDP